MFKKKGLTKICQLKLSTKVDEKNHEQNVFTISWTKVVNVSFEQENIIKVANKDVNKSW